MNELSLDTLLYDESKNQVEKGTLYLVATPIGNLSDISFRAVKILSSVDFIAAEDTRNSAKLLHVIGIKKPLVSYHEHNKRERGEEITARLQSGESCALVTDAGMPAISDPGEDLVRLCAAKGITVTCVPGACAAVSALALSALDSRHFVFEGFLPVQNAERKQRLLALKGDRRTVILYEAPHKLRRTLSDLLDTFGHSRRLSLCRELTKKNEEILRTCIGDAVALYKDQEPRGEYVLILEGADESGEPLSASVEASAPLSFESCAAHVAYYEQKGLAHMDAIKAAAKDRGIGKSEFYRMLCDENEQ